MHGQWQVASHAHILYDTLLLHAQKQAASTQLPLGGLISFLSMPRMPRGSQSYSFLQILNSRPLGPH
jgi:hypothetical protein